jgi:hypothetical protein
MHRVRFLSVGRAALLLGIAAASLAISQTVAPAHAQVSAEVSVDSDFRVALGSYGAWRRHTRFGDVWVPADRPRDWRPYTVGHWVYTDEYGWYWVSDDQEADWGWITYHYGRWYRDADYGWLWIPDNVWGPAWVDWRYGDQYVGWAPEPPEAIVSDVQDDPSYWSFVTAGDLIAPSIATVRLPFDRGTEIFRHTTLANRPVMMRGPGSDRRFAVNPGIPPGSIAAIRGRPLPTYQVRPHVLAGTAALRGAIQVHAADLRRGGADRALFRERVTAQGNIRATRATLQPLSRGEAGRLGASPPRAARNAAIDQRAAPQTERRTGQRQDGVAPPNISSRPKTTQAPASRREGRIEQRGDGPQRSSERTPAARVPPARQGVTQRGPAARPTASRPLLGNRPAAIAAPRQIVRSPAAPSSGSRPPAFTARPQPPAIAPRAAAPRPAAPPAAVARPAPVRPAAPVTTGAAPRGGTGQRRPQ